MRNAERITANVAIDRRLNAVILTGSADEIAALAQEIKAIDLPDAKHISVQIEAQVVELTHSSAAQLGLDFSNNGAVASASISSQTLSTAFASAQFQAKLFATIQRGEGHLLSSPRLSTLDDTEASILTGDALPIITTITYPGNPPTVQEQLQYVNVGVHLQIKPDVSSGYVTSTIVAEVSDVTGFIQGNIPQISQRQTITTARVRDGESFVIGGLLQDNEIRNASKIPIIGDLPLLGELFRFQTSTHQETNLYIIVTPRVRIDGAESAAPPEAGIQGAH